MSPGTVYPILFPKTLDQGLIGRQEDRASQGGKDWNQKKLKTYAHPSQNSWSTSRKKKNKTTNQYEWMVYSYTLYKIIQR